MKQFFGIIFFVILFIQAYCQTKEVPFTLDDRDRIIRTEVEIKSLRNEMNSRFEAIDSKFEAIDSKFEAMNNKIDVLFWGFGIVITLILFLFGYIIVDRKTGIKPLEQDMSIVKHRQNNLSKAMSELAQVDKKFAEAIRKVAL